MMNDRPERNTDKASETRGKEYAATHIHLIKSKDIFKEQEEHTKRALHLPFLWYKDNER